MPTILLLAAVPGAFVVLGAGSLYGKLVTGSHWGPWRLPIGLVALVLGVGAWLLLLDGLLREHDWRGLGLILGPVYVVVAGAAFVGGARYSRWVSRRAGPGHRRLWHRWPAFVPRVVVPALVLLTGVVLVAEGVSAP